MAEYHVAKEDPAADDGNPGTLILPWLTLGKACDGTATTGDTVYVHVGTYSEDHYGVALYPSVSGVTFENYNSEAVNVLAPGGYGFYLDSGIDNITIWGIDFDQGSTAASTARMLGVIYSNYNTIGYCTLKYTDELAAALRGIQLGGSWNTIIGNEIGKIGVLGDAGWGEGIWLTENAGYNLIQSNVIYDCSHNCVFTNGAHHNVIKANEFYNAYWRTAGANGLSLDDKHNIFEDNIFHDNYGSTSWGTKVSGFQNAAGHTIFRRNQLYDLVGVAWTIGGYYDEGDCYSENAYYYHNSCYNLYTEDTSWSAAVECVLDVAEYVTNTHIINNIFYVYNHNQGNIFYDNEGSPSMIDDRGNWWGTTSGNPLYTNPGAGTLTLQSGSSCRNNGVWLTTITSTTGSGTSFVVADAMYFTDGMGIIDGDVIQIEGQTQAARITGINYSTNTITVNMTLNWTQGNGVALAYSGTAPDQGYYEHPEGSSDYVYFGSIPITVTPSATYEGPIYTEILEDGGFEEWDDAFTPTHWGTDLYGTSTVNREASVVHGGTYAARIDIDADNEIASIYNLTITLLPSAPPAEGTPDIGAYEYIPPEGVGTRYRMTFWYGMSEAAKTAQISFRDSTGTVFLDSDGTWTTDPWHTITIPNATDWTQFAIDFYAHMSYTDYFFDYYNLSAASASLYIDDLTFSLFYDEFVYTGNIPITITPTSAYVQGFAYAGNIPITITPQASYSTVFVPITIPSGEIVNVFVDETYRITRITKNMGDMTCDIVAVKVSEGSEA